MFAISNLLVFLAKAVRFLADPVLKLYSWVIIARALITWVNPDPYNSIVQFLGKITDPVLAPIRKIFPLHLKIGIDISPLIALFAVYLVQFFLNDFVVQTLIELAYKLR